MFSDKQSCRKTTHPSNKTQLMKRLVLLCQVHSGIWKFGGNGQIGYATLPSKLKINLAEDESKKPVRHIINPRAAKKTSLTCVLPTMSVVPLAATKVNIYTSDIFDISLFNSLSKVVRFWSMSNHS